MARPSNTVLPLADVEILDTMLNGYKWNFDDPSNKVIYYSTSGSFFWNFEFLESDQFQAQLNRLFSNIGVFLDIEFRPLGYFKTTTTTEGYKEAYKAGSDINFSSISSGFQGDFYADDGLVLTPFSSQSTLAYSTFPSTESQITRGYEGAPGDIWLNYDSPYVQSLSYDVGEPGYLVLLHEVFHGLGLKHPHDDGGTGRPTFQDVGATEFDRQIITAMSYDFSHNGGDGVLHGSLPIAPMLNDLVGLQYLYGEAKVNLGNDTHQIDSLGDYYSILFDPAGNDTLDFSLFPEKVSWYMYNTLVNNGINDYRWGTVMTIPGRAKVFFDEDPFPDFMIYTYGDFENAKGSAFNDHFSGNVLNNRFEGGGSDDWLEGKIGLDTAVFTGNREEYSITINRLVKTGDTGDDEDYLDNIISDNVSSRNGTDKLTAIERLEFADGTLVIDVEGGETAGQAYRLYQAAFARTPDMPGVKYHMNDMESNGLSVTQIAGNFIASPEFKTQYGENPTEDEYVNLLYQNVLGRTPQQFEVDYYKERFEQGTTDWNTTLVFFAESPENIALVGPDIANGIWLPT